MFPLKDDNPTSRLPIITLLLVIANSFVFLYGNVMQGEEFILRYAAIPANIMTLGGLLEQNSLKALSTIFTSQFIHGNFLHIFGNMLFLWIFGNNVEDRMGRIAFTIFYLTCGAAAVFAQMIGNPYSQMPMVGASGAIAGVMGAYLLMFPHAKVLTLFFIVIFIRMVWVPAYFVILLWIFLQVIYQLSANPEAGGVAYLAHIGGFAAGVVLLMLYRPFIRARI